MIKKILIRILLAFLIFFIVVAVNLAFFIKNSKIISEGEPISVYNTTHSALLVIDIQEATTGSVSVDNCYKEHSDSFISQTNQIISAAQDKNIQVIYIRSEVNNKLVNLINNSMAPNSKGSQLDHRLKVISENIIPKEKQDAFSNPLLDEILIKHKINKLYIIGLDAAQCVYSTIQAAKNRSYRITVIREAVISETEELKAQMLVKYEELNAHVISMNEFIH